MKKGQYCVFNKQYGEKEYEELVAKIIEQMNEMPYISKIRNSKSEIRNIEYKYGEFFPPEISPFAYNEVVAQEYFPVAEDKAIEEGFGWRKPDAKNYQITLAAENIPGKIADANDSILEQIIGCSHKGRCEHQCTTAFRLIPAELQFYKKAGIPIPRLCGNCRHCERLLRRNPVKLWHRSCMCNEATSDMKQETRKYKNTSKHFHGAEYCLNEFETSYPPDSPYIVYCEQCYQTEVV